MTVVAGPEPGDMRQLIRSRLRCRVLTRPEAVSVAMHDPPPAARTLADVRHPERSLTAGRAVDQAHVPFYVDRVGQVAARAGREVADAGVPLPETAGRPIQTPANGVPALLVPSPSPKIVMSSAWDHNCLQRPASPLTNRSIPPDADRRTHPHSAPVHAHRWTRRVCLDPRARPGRPRRSARLPRPLGVPLRTGQTGGHSAARPGPVCVLELRRPASRFTAHAEWRASRAGMVMRWPGPSLRGGSAVPEPECGQRQARECYQRAYDLKGVVV